MTTRVTVLTAAFALAAALSAPAPVGAQAQGFSDDEFCRALSEEAAAANRRGSFWIDVAIRDDGMAVFCVQKTVEYRLYMNLDPSHLTAEWQNVRQAHWSVRNCREPTLSAIRNGWKIVEVLRVRKSHVFPQGRQHRIVAECR
ncbi:MAG: hypothetical protein AAB543_08775 [Pseudomonadota bacterium]